MVIACVVRNPFVVRGASCVGQPAVEEFGPIGDHEFAIWSFAELAPRLAIRIAIDDDDIPVIGLAARLGFGKLRRVERPVASAPNDDDVPQRSSLPPSTTRMVPVT